MRGKSLLPLAISGAFFAMPAFADDGAAKTSDEGNGFDLKLLYTGEEWGDVRGGAKRATTNINDLDAQLAFNPEKLLGWQGGSVLLDVVYDNGRSGDSLTGAGQQVSPIDFYGPQLFRIYQAWYNQDFFEGRTSVLAGLYDPNTEFDTLDSAALFLNSGYGWNTALDQSGRNGPSTFPDTSLGTRLREKWGDAQQWVVQAAVLDGTPDNPNRPRENTIDISHKNGALLMGEAAYHPGDTTKILAGYWRYTAQFNDLRAVDAGGNPRKDSDNQGVYAGIHQHLYTAQNKASFDGFVNIGASSGDINRYDRSLDAGVNIHGLLPGRDSDQLGLAWNIAHISNSYQQAQLASSTPSVNNEFNYELTYRAVITDWLTLQPDVQYIVNPATNATLKNAWVLGMHLEIGHNFGF